MFNRLICPRSNSESFGQLQSLQLDGQSFPIAQIHLFSGHHVSANKGFGALHIWAEHKKEMQKFGFNTYEEVPHFVERIVAPNTPVLYEGGNFRTTRLIAARSSFGIAILEWRHSEFWSVVTAYLKPNARGKLVGKIQ